MIHRRLGGATRGLSYGVARLASAADDDPDAIARALHEHGACWLTGFPDPALTCALRDDLLRLRDEAALAPAGTGRAAAHALRPQLRGDRTLWLDDPRCGAPASAYLHALDALRLNLNRRLFLGLREVEAHYACYPPGTGYARHRDRFRDSDLRMVSLVSYLNADWDEADGGALRLHTAGGAVDVAPAGGSSVCFLSEFEHEVLPATRERLSIAAWFRRGT